MSTQEQMNFTKRKGQMFLQFLAETGRVRHSAKQAGIDIKTLYARRASDPDFLKNWETACQMAGDRYEDEAVRRAVDGVDRDVYYKGEVVGQERQYSDGLLAKLMDGSNPAKYNPKKDSQTNVQVNVGLAVIPMTAPTMEEWERDAMALQDQQPQIIDQKPLPALPAPSIASRKVVVA